MVRPPWQEDQRTHDDAPCVDATSGERHSTSLPWWGYMMAAFALMNIVLMGRASQTYTVNEEQRSGNVAQTSSSRLRGGDQRRLEEYMTVSITDSMAMPLTANISAEEELNGIHVSVPCLGWYAYKGENHQLGHGGLLSPCGKIFIGNRGQDIKHPFGSFHIPDKDGIHAWAESVDQSFVNWVWAAFGLLLLLDILWHGIFYCCPALQPDFFDELNDLWEGKLSPPDDFLTPEEAADWKASKVMDTAKGNIFRVLAVFEPRDPNVGWYRWSQYVIRCVLCAWLQLYLPYSMISQELATWTFHGPKSIFWLSTHFGQFVAMFAALGQLAIIFFGMAKTHLIKGARANYFLLSHKSPFRGTGAYSAINGNSNRSLRLANQPQWALGDKLFRIQQYFWCILSMTINFAMSLMLPLVFLLKTATYHGEIGSIAIEITSLYFVFDLDTRIFESDPGVDARYRYVIKRAIAAGLRPESKHLTLMKRIVGVTQILIDKSVKYLLLFALAFAWEGEGVVIGASPF